MLKNSVIIIPNPSSESQVCDFLLQTASFLAKDNFVFVPTFSSNSRNYTKDKINFLRFWQILPFKRFVFINKWNRLIYFFLLQAYLNIRYLKYKKRYLWIFFPEFADILKVKAFYFKTIFDIVDFHFSPILEKQKLLKEQKNILLKNSDHLFSISKSLADFYQVDSKIEIKVVPQGFAWHDFSLRNIKTKLILPKGKPLIGFIGQMSERLDLNLLSELVKNNPQWNFIFIGPKHHESNVSTHYDEQKIDEIFTHDNVFYCSSQPKNTMLSIIEQFDVCLIPYDVSYDFNRYSYPMKTFEYFYAGKPVVSTEIEELKKFPELIFMANSAKGFAELIENALIKPWSEKLKAKQFKLANENSWNNKLEEISKHIS